MEASGKPRAGARTVQAVERAIRILEALAAGPEGLPLGAVADRVGIRPQTAQSLLRTLQAHEMVVQTGRGAPYWLGPAVQRLAHRLQGPQHRAAKARPLVRDLADRLGEYVLLAELRGSVVVGLVEVQAARHLMVTGEIEFGGRLHNMATAQAILAYAPAPQVDRLIAGMELTKTGPGTVTTPAGLRRRLARVRAQCYALCVEESSAGVVALAMPVRDPSGEVNCALGVALPLTRFNKARQAELRSEVLDCSRRIEHAWGSPEGPPRR